MPELTDEELIQIVVALQTRKEDLEQMKQIYSKEVLEEEFDSPIEDMEEWLEQTESSIDKISSMLGDDVQAVIDNWD